MEHLDPDARKDQSGDVESGRMKWYWRVWSDGLISPMSEYQLSWDQQDICISSDTFEFWYELDYSLNIYSVFSRIEEMASDLWDANNVQVHMISTLEEHLAKRVYFERPAVNKRNSEGLYQKKLL